MVSIGPIVACGDGAVYKPAGLSEESVMVKCFDSMHATSTAVLYGNAARESMGDVTQR